jgi:hypothetical protein
MTDPVQDLLLDDDGDLAFDGADFALVSGSQAIAQACRMALSLFVGEDSFDQTAGARWHDLLGSKTATDDDFANEVRRVLLDVLGVSTVDNVVVTRNATRTAQVVADVTTDAGELLQVVETIGG